MPEKLFRRLRLILAKLCLRAGDLDDLDSAQIPALQSVAQRYETRISELTRDLDELRRDREGLLEHYRILTGNLAAAVVIRDEDQHVSYCSPYTEVLTGYPLAQIYQTNGDFFSEIVHPDDREKYQRALKIVTAGEPFQYRYRLFHKSGIEMWVETRTVPVCDNQGKLLFSLSVTLDVTGTVRYQSQVEEKNRELRDFTYMVSHDLKAPIFTIKGMLEIINSDAPAALDPESQEALQHISKAADRLDQLVKSVLQYSKINSQELKPEPVALESVFEEVSSELHHEISRAGGEISLPTEYPQVLGDKLRLYQIFSNLLGNAVKYRAADRPLKIQVAWSGGANPREIKVEVSDNGLGIPDDKTQDIFRPFHRIHAGHAEGSGIGLASVKRLLEKLGGTIEVKSKEGSGSTFSVTLRRAGP